MGKHDVRFVSGFVWRIVGPIFSWGIFFPAGTIASYPPEKIGPGTFHKTLTNLLVILNLAVSMDENR